MLSRIAAPNWSGPPEASVPDRKSTRLNSSHSQISYAVFCLKKKNKTIAALYAARIIEVLLQLGLHSQSNYDAPLDVMRLSDGVLLILDECDQVRFRDAYRIR